MTTIPVSGEPAEGIPVSDSAGGAGSLPASDLPAPERSSPGRLPVFRVTLSSIDADTAWDLRPDLVRALYTQGPVLCVDLGTVRFIDSTGLGMLVGVLKEAREMHGDLHLLNAGREVRRIFDVTGLDDLFHCAESIDAVPAPHTGAAGEGASGSGAGEGAAGAASAAAGPATRVPVER
jgi:anti-sigma B factor antagonist